MAALRLGVGDVFTVCKGVVDLCKAEELKTKDIKSMLAEMELMREHLNAINTKAQEKQGRGRGKEFRDGREDITPIITRSLQPIHRDLSQMQQLLRHHQERKKSVHVLDQARYMLHYRAKLDAFKECVERHRESICVIRELVECEDDAGNVAGGKRRESMVKLAGLVESEEMRAQEEGYENGWVDEVERFKGIAEEEDEEGPFAQPSPNGTDPIAKTNFWEPASGPLLSRPAFKLDVFESTSHRPTGIVQDSP